MTTELYKFPHEGRSVETAIGMASSLSGPMPDSAQPVLPLCQCSPDARSPATSARRLHDFIRFGS